MVDPALREWILPNFSMTTITDTTVCSMVMMAMMKVSCDYGYTVPLCMEEMVMCNAGVVLSPIHSYVTCNAGLVSTSENV